MWAGEVGGGGRSWIMPSSIGARQHFCHIMTEKTYLAIRNIDKYELSLANWKIKNLLNQCILGFKSGTKQKKNKENTFL